MNNNIQCSIESSTTSMELNSAADGIYLVPELEGLAGLPEIRTTSGVNAGYDGGWTSAQNYDARLIAIRGVIADKDIAKVEATRRKLASLLGQGRKEQLTLRFTTEAGNAYTISVRTISCEMALQRVLNKQDFLIQLRADDPLIYDDGASGGTEAILRVQQALGGFEINFGLPLSIGGSSDATAVENGAETVYPIIKLYGPLHSPTVVNMTTNQQMQIIADLGYTITWSGWTGVSGERLSIPNELDKEAPLRLWSVDGNIEQTTYTGKNLIGAPDLAQTTINGLSVKIENGVFTLNGTPTATAFFGTTTNFAFGTITSNITLELIGESGSFTSGIFGVSSVDSGGTQVQWHQVTGSSSANKSNTKEYTSTVKAQIAGARFYANANSTFSNYKFRVQMTNGSTADYNYEPYVGGQPSPSPSYPQAIETVTGRQTVTVTGKNLLNVEKTTQTVNGVTFTINEDKTIIANGTASALVTFNLINTTFTLPSGQYYLSGCPSGGSDSTYRLDINNGADGNQRDYGNGRTFTLNQSTTINNVRIRIASGATLNGLIFKPMINTGSTAQPYEPYEAQNYEINLGKNLWGGFANDFSKSLGGITFVTKADGTITNTAGTTSATAYSAFASEATSNGLTKTLEAGTYCISGASGDITLDVCDTSGTTLATDSGNGATFTLSAKKTVFVRIRVASGKTLTAGTTKPQLEKGSTASSFAPHFEPIELCKIGTHQDRIYKENGKWWLHKEIGEVVFDGSENWSLINSGASNFYYNLPVFVTPKDQDIMPVSNYFVGTPITNGNTSVGLWITNTGTIRVRKETEQTLADFKTWLGTALPSVYYVLATPTDTEITDEEVLEGLEALGDATLYIGTNNVYTDTPSAVPTLEVDYPTDYDETHDTVVIDSQARTVTLNGADIYHLKTEESEFPVLAPGENRMYLTSVTTSDTGYAEVKFKQGYLSI